MTARTLAGLPLLAGMARSECVKLWTLRSTYWTLLAAVLAMAGFGGLLDAAYLHHLTPAARAVLQPAAFAESGFFLAQLAIGVLGVLTMTGEYATGAIRGTLTAAPQRVTLLAAKAGVFTIVAFIVGLLGAFLALFLGAAIFAGSAIHTSLSAPGAVRAVLGAALYLAVFGLLSLGIGTLIRRTAGAIAVMITLLILLPAAAGALPATWRDAISRYLPTAAGQMIIGHTKFTPAGPSLAPWTGFAVLCAYTAVTLVAAGVALRARDA